MAWQGTGIMNPKQIIVICILEMGTAYITAAPGISYPLAQADVKKYSQQVKKVPPPFTYFQPLFYRQHQNL